MIRVTKDFYILLNKGVNSEKAFSLMQAREGVYDPDLLAALEAEYMEMEQGYVLREVPVAQLHPGYLVAEDILSIRGVVLLKRKTEISNVLIHKLIRLAHENIIPSKLKVLVNPSAQ